MTTTDYILNAVFVLLVLRQARERELDARSVIVPLLVVFFVASNYVHSIPTAGNDLVLLGGLGAVGVTLGVLGGFATHVRFDDGGRALFPEYERRVAGLLRLLRRVMAGRLGSRPYACNNTLRPGQNRRRDCQNQ